MTREPLPRLSGAADPAVKAWADRLVDTLQRQLDDATRAAKGGFTFTTATPTTTLDASTATATAVANTLAALVIALRTAGRIT